MPNGLKGKLKIRFTGPIVICLGMLLFFSIFAENFFTASNAVNIIRQGCVLALVSFGQTFVIIVGGFDLSVGAVMGLTACTSAILMVKAGLSVLAAVIIALLLATLCGFINGLVTNYVKVNAFISTFGMWGMALGVALVITDERVVFGFPDTLRVFHDGNLLGIPVPLIIVAIVWAILHFVLKSTPYGVATYAIGGNETAAGISGIPVRLHQTLVYTFCGFMAGIAGLMFMARSNAAQAVDPIGYEFDSCVAVILGGNRLFGGKGGVTETLVGVAIIAGARNGLNMMGVNPYLQLVFIGAILILAYIVEDRKAQLGSTRATLLGMITGGKRPIH